MLLFVCKNHGELAAGGYTELDEEIICNKCCEPISIVNEEAVCPHCHLMIRRRAIDIQKDIQRITGK